MEKILILDFGGQYNQLIARRVRAQHVFAEIVSSDRIPCEKIRETGYRGDFTFEGTGFDQTGHVDIGGLNEQFALARTYLNGEG